MLLLGFWIRPGDGKMVLIQTSTAPPKVISACAAASKWPLALHFLTSISSSNLGFQLSFGEGDLLIVSVWVCDLHCWAPVECLRTATAELDDICNPESVWEEPKVGRSQQVFFWLFHLECVWIFLRSSEWWFGWWLLLKCSGEFSWTFWDLSWQVATCPWLADLFGCFSLLGGSYLQRSGHAIGDLAAADRSWQLLTAANSRKYSEDWQFALLLLKKMEQRLLEVRG